MKKISKQVIIGVGLIAVLFVATLMIYKVDVTEYAVVTQFGNPVNVSENPGLKVKLPDPVQSVQKLDKRVQVYQTNSIELLTLDKKSVSLDYYGSWKIKAKVMQRPFEFMEKHTRKILSFMNLSVHWKLMRKQ